MARSIRGAIHVIVRDHANGVFGRGAAQNILGSEIVADFGGGEARAVHVEYHDIRGDPRGINFNASNCCKTLGQMLGVFVIARETLG